MKSKEMQQGEVEERQAGQENYLLPFPHLGKQGLLSFHLKGTLFEIF